MSIAALFSRLGSIALGRRTATVSRDAGAVRGTIATWRVPRVYSQAGQNSERALIQGRAGDLYVNDWAARSVVNSISTNAIGTGLLPQVRLPYKRLGITAEQARELQSQMEWLWAEWCEQCHVKGRMHFGDLQLAGFRSVLRDGELLHVPVMRDTGPGRRFGLAIQDISPSRLSTPSDRQTDLHIRDGVELSECGERVAFWIATPKPSILPVDMSALASVDYTRIPARVGHRPGVFHLFFNEVEEQERGVSILSPGIKLFRHLADAITHELYGQVANASVPMVVETSEENVRLPEWVQQETRGTPEGGEEKVYYQNVEAGTLYYLNEGEHLKTVESSRPSPNFLNFCELVIRGCAASADMPYEAVMKDFSKTNYSSARAAMLEAWRVYLMYRAWFARNYCQPIFNMVMEEAWLRGILELPSSAPDFYEAMPLWCNATWIGPARGYVDPVKEATANINLNAAGLKTRKEILAEQGLDFEEVMDDLTEEAKRMAEYHKIAGEPAGGAAMPVLTAPADDGGEDEEKNRNRNRNGDDESESGQGGRSNASGDE